MTYIVDDAIRRISEWLPAALGLALGLVILAVLIWGQT